MDAILHGIGLCGDTHSHLDLLDLIFGGAVAGGALGTIKYYSTGLILIIKDKFNGKSDI